MGISNEMAKVAEDTKLFQVNLEWTVTSTRKISRNWAGG